ncbi:U-box domain-containing protein 32 isoform X1 [Pyrus x bretschneideri]|uniref:U-box domain-containing protein 32 isoform X1 n=1 Tax=Pyrus x bretschneideri TaxID=225117 RepID=UPI00202F9967|nr:U-box domain-containing protein 32 isoform X1 [Pyrus x bretschneideri]
MGSVGEVGEGRVLSDVEETIFVAVGKDLKQSETTLAWAVKNFAGKRICLLHVHKPSLLLSLSEGIGSASKLKQGAVKALQGAERTKLRKLLDQYRMILTGAGVEANELWIEMGNIEEGIVEIIARHHIRWLVMGAAADEHYSERLAEIKSRKAFFVCQEAARSCHIWFVCKGHLIYTRGDREDESEIEIAPPLLLMNSAFGTEQPEHLRSESTDSLRNLSSADAEEDTSELEQISGRSTPLMIDAEGEANGESHHSVEQAIVDTKNLKQKELEETTRRWKEEDDEMEAKCKKVCVVHAFLQAKAFESLCTKEMSQRKEMEEKLARLKQEIDGVKDESEEFIRQLSMVEDKKLVLEKQLEASQCEVKELEEKIISAAGLLMSFREKRDTMKIEHRNAMRKVRRLETMINGEAASFDQAEFPIFSFMEINEATHNFDPSWKIKEGRRGSVYKGILRHMHVAIKMLPSYGSKTQLDFEHEVEVLSRVRHPNLVTLIGTCPESRSLVYEYLKNGCLEDLLACKDSTPPLPWQIRTSIATEICSALIFLHSNIPCLVHGNLKPSNILFDANFVSKLINLGINSLIPQNENPTNFTKICSDPNGAHVYMDPEYLETGKLTPESDVYSFGIILLQLLTARPLSGLVKDVKYALENDNFKALLDVSAGDWPLEQAKEMAYIALRCCENKRLDRLDLLVAHEAMRASCAASASCLVSKKLIRTPSHFLCPILQEVMQDPHIAADGFTYEEEAIRGWLKSGHNTSPMTNLELEHCKLVPNYALQYAIQQWQLQL